MLDWLRDLWLSNTLIVLAGTMLLGLGAGVIGTFMQLRKRALLGDVISHASLPGIAIGYLLAEACYPGEGRQLIWLWTGALASGLLGVGLLAVIRRTTRIAEDASFAIVLSVFFGCGIVLLTMIQSLPTGNRAGLDEFIFGKTAAIVLRDVWAIGLVSLVITVACLALSKELQLVCFDEEFARTQGWAVTSIDFVMMAAVAVITIVGLPAVGLLLIVALVVLPATAARFWSQRLMPLVAIAGGFGMTMAAVGTLASAAIPRVPAGPLIVLAGTVIFGLSAIWAPELGLWSMYRRRRDLQQRIALDDFLRTLFERVENAVIPLAETRTSAVSTSGPAANVAGLKVAVAAEPSSELGATYRELQQARNWTDAEIATRMGLAERRGLVWEDAHGRIRLTANGVLAAKAAVHRHRVWELYLIRRTDLPPRLADRKADYSEHWVDPDLVAALEAELTPDDRPPWLDSPHPLSAG